MICKKHPKYRGLKQPKDCLECWKVYYVELVNKHDNIENEIILASTKACCCETGQASTSGCYFFKVSQDCPVHYPSTLMFTHLAGKKDA